MEKINIITKKVKKLNNTAGYIPMKFNEIGEEFVVLSMKDLEFLVGRKLE